jgi:hypothetical protein
MNELVNVTTIGELASITHGISLGAPCSPLPMWSDIPANMFEMIL